MPRALLVAALVVGAALRLYPLRTPYVNPDQEAVPIQALSILASATWRPPDFVYPSGFLYVLRMSDAVTLWWRARAGTARDAVDLLAAYLADPFSFLLVARAWACAFGIATIALAGALGRYVAGGRAGAAAALLVAVSPLHVRESHYGTGDVPASALFTAALVAATAYAHAPCARTLVGAGALAGVAAAFRYPAVLAIAGVVGAAAAVPLPSRARVRQLAGAILASAAAFTVVSPYTMLEPVVAWRRIADQLFLARVGIGVEGLSLVTLLAAGSGVVACVLAAAGVVLLVAERRRAVVPLLAAALPALLALSRTTRTFARYTLPLVPVVAVLAGAALAIVAARGGTRPWRGVATLLLAAAVGESARESLAIVRLLAREDTRIAAGAFLRDIPPPIAVFVPRSLSGYANPILPLTGESIAWRLERDVAADLHVRTRAEAPARTIVPYDDGEPASLARIGQLGGLVVTTSHPHPGLWHWAGTAPATLRFLRAHGVPVATYVGMGEGVPADAVLFEPIDANFVPLRGAERLAAPGPTITVWRVPTP